MLRNLMIIFLLFSTSIIAKQLVHIEIRDGQDSEKILSNYSNPIYYEDRFILTIESDLWKPTQSTQTILGNWNTKMYYYILYPIQQKNYGDVSKYGTILFTNRSYLIFETEYEVLNDFKAFHQFEIVRLFDKEPSDIEVVKPNSYPSPLEFNSVIQHMVDSVNVDSIWDHIATLQSMERYTSNLQAIESSNYLKDYYTKLGFDTVYFHDWHSGWIPNVIAIKYGKQFPEEIYIVGGHYDVYSNGAPGADDNGSGTAAIMEIGRVLSNVSYKRTIRLIGFSGEEMGLLGSAAYASHVAQQGDNILGMINVDMIAYVAPGDLIDVDLIKNTPSTDLANAYINASQLYVPLLSIVNGTLIGGTSDHASFWNNGYMAIFPFEDNNQYSPYIHTFNDVLGTSANNQTLAELGTKSVVATVASLAEIAESRITGHIYSSATLSPIDSAKIFFNDDSVQSDLDGYYITPPLDSGIYTITFSAAGFTPDTMVHSLQQYEVFTANAYLIPTGSLRPYVHLENIVIDDDSTGGSLGNGNGIADAGETIEIFGNFMNTGNLNAYEVSALIQSNDPWINILSDSIEVDSILIGDMNLSNNAFLIEVDSLTPANSVVQFSLDINYQGYTSASGFEITVHNRGEVIIIEDDDGENGLAAYKLTLDSLGISYDVGNPDTPLEVIEEYDLMIWFCGDDYNSTLTTSDQQKLSDYLDNGGKLFINGNDVGYDIHNDPFYSNYLKALYIGDGPYTTTSTAYGINGDPISGDFTGGIGISTNYVDQINPAGGSEKIFTYNYNSTNYGCGIKYDGSYQLVYLTFIFENISDVDDRKLLLYNIFNWFGVITDINPFQDQLIEKFTLSQNYPNPFNPVTNIGFGLAKSTYVKIDIFNILGQQVTTLLDTKKPAGYHIVQFDGRKFASGVYFYRIKAGEFSDVKKMVLMK